MWASLRLPPSAEVQPAAEFFHQSVILDSLILGTPLLQHLPDFSCSGALCPLGSPVNSKVCVPKWEVKRE